MTLIRMALSGAHTSAKSQQSSLIQSSLINVRTTLNTHYFSCTLVILAGFCLDLLLNNSIHPNFYLDLHQTAFITTPSKSQDLVQLISCFMFKVYPCVTFQFPLPFLSCIPPPVFDLYLSLCFSFTLRWFVPSLLVATSLSRVLNSSSNFLLPAFCCLAFWHFQTPGISSSLKSAFCCSTCLPLCLCLGP